MEWPMGVNLIYAGDEDPLCTLDRGKGLDGQVRFRGYMRDSRLKSKSGPVDTRRHQPHRRECTLYSRGSLQCTFSMISYPNCQRACMCLVISCPNCQRAGMGLVVSDPNCQLAGNCLVVSCPNCYSRQAWAWWLVAPTASGQACAWWLVAPTASRQARA